MSLGGMLKQIRVNNVGYEGDINGLILVVVFPRFFFLWRNYKISGGNTRKTLMWKYLNILAG
jgi:hypothetical protein